MVEWHARAPVRFCDLGGWTDTRLVPQGVVLNFAATIYTYVTLKVEEGAGEVVLERLDTGEKRTFDDVRSIEYDGVLDLIKAAIARWWEGSGSGRGAPQNSRTTVLIRSDAPPASGLGSSASLGVAAVAALAAERRKCWLPHELAREAQLLEVEDLHLECGVQDQLAAAYGGVNYMEVEYPSARVFPLHQLRHGLLYELEERFVLAYTGKPRFSSEIHKSVISNSGKHGDVFERLARCAVKGKEALLSGDLNLFASAMNDNWEAQKCLHPNITTPEIEALCDAAFQAGAVGFKANGAGGGGTVTILAGQNRRAELQRVVSELGMLVLPTQIDLTGVQVWAAT